MSYKTKSVSLLILIMSCLLMSSVAGAQNCGLIPSGGGESISAQITIKDTGAPVADGKVLTAGTQLRLDTIAKAFGECSLRGPNSTPPHECIELAKYNRTINHINVKVDITTATSLNGQYVAGYVFGLKPDGTTADWNVLDTRASNSTGPNYFTLPYPGTYTFRFQGIINTTPCLIQPGQTKEITITVHVREREGETGGTSGGGASNGWPAIANECDLPAVIKPPRQTVSHLGWNMEMEVTDKDGLVVSNVTLNGRYMAESISVPYFTLQTSLFPRQRGELKPFGLEAVMRSKFVGWEIHKGDDRLVITAVYLIDRLPGGSQSCIHIAQRYEFLQPGLGGACEPSDTLPCTRWRPMVKYKFNARGNETLTAVNVPQRLHFRVDRYTRNSIGLFRDCDEPFLHIGPPFIGCGFNGVIFTRKENPVFSEFLTTVISRGQSTNQWDNIHQTYKGDVDEPPTDIISGILGGCPECVHTHWRWGAAQGEKFGSGRPIIPPGSTQDVDIAVARYREGEEHPQDYTALINRESIRGPYQGWMDIAQSYKLTAPEDVVFWYSATGHLDQDELYWHGSFFNQASRNQARNIVPGSSGAGAPVASPKATAVTHNSFDPVSPDKPTTITFDYLFEDGETTYTEIDPEEVEVLPNGYSAYHNVGYQIGTDSEASGSHIINFSVASIDDQALFDSLRVLHAEKDPFDPDKTIWVDRTIHSPDAPAPDFASRTISARVNNVGFFVIATPGQSEPPATSVADLSIQGSNTPNPVVSGNDLTYTLAVTNNGPQSATRAVLINGISPDVNFVSATSTQGTCKEINGTVSCNLDALAVGATATVTLIVKPTEGELRFPAEGKSIVNVASVRANEDDPEFSDNTATTDALALPDPNAPPTINITNPTPGAMYAGPANIALNATASDSDGSISKVELYGDGGLIGTATTTGSNQYSLGWNNVTFGNHSLLAVATDDLGRKARSVPVNIIVNGAATVSITSPTGPALFNRPVDLTISAAASIGTGSISKVDFYASGNLIGTGTSTEPGQYSLIWPNLAAGDYSLIAVAVDDAGITTTSSPVSITINTSPAVSITSPANGSVLTSPASVTIEATAHDSDGFINRVDFFANGSLIGSRSQIVGDNYSLTWNNPASGNYSLTAVAVDDRGVITISSPLALTINSDANTAAFVSQSVPDTMAAGHTYNVSVTMRNTGGTTWTASNLYNLGSQNPQDNSNWGANRVAVPATVAPGADATFNWIVTAPTTPGTYSFQWQMLQNVSGWFGDLTPAASVNVVAEDPGTGLKGEYFNNRMLSGSPVVTRTDATVGFDWSGGSPDPAISNDGFSVLWSGQIEPEFSETYTFYTTSDDGVRLWIDGRLVIDHWAAHAATEDSGTITLVAGQKNDLRMEYYDDTGGAVAKLSWSSPSQVKEIVRRSQLYPQTSPGASVRGMVIREYWSNIPGAAVSDLTGNSNYPATPTGNIQLRSFEAPSGLGDNYGARIRGFIHPPQDGSYTFWIASDDTSELWLSTDLDPAHKILIASVPGWSYSQEWTKYPQQQSQPVTLLAGQKYYIEALHKESTAGDHLAVAWQTPGAERMVIPGIYLSTYGGANNLPPTVALTSPANGATYTTPSSITITADAADTDGVVSKVEFFQGSSKLGEDNSSPYTLTWSNVAAGSYALTVKATDNEGLAATSGAVNVTVIGQHGTISGHVMKSDGATAIAGAAIKLYLDTTLVASATADGNGDYIITDLDTGTYRVEATASGYVTQSQTGVAVTDGATTTLNFSLNANPVPSITGFTPAIGNAGTSVTITGTSFDVNATNDVVKFNATSSVLNSATETTIVTSVPSGATSGRITITTPGGTATSTGDFFVPPSPFTAADVDTTGRMVNGESKTVAISTGNKIGLILFEGSAGHRISLKISAVTMGGSGYSQLAIYKPDGTTLISPSWVNGGGGFFDTRTLPVDGTYTILVDPEYANTGSLTLSLYDVPPDVTASITAGGPEVTVATTTPGQNAKLTFEGTAGQRVSLKMNNVTMPPTGYSQVSISNPNGTTLISPAWVNGGGGFFDTRTLPTTGTYTILVDPETANTGSMTLKLYDVPADITGTMTPGGSSLTVAISTAGQNARLSFNGTAGQRVSLKVSEVAMPPTGYSQVSIYGPGNTTLVFPTWVSGGGGFFDALQLPATGSYTILVDPETANTGSLLLTLYDVVDVTGVTTIGGLGLNVSTTVPGQNARISFEGASTQQAAVQISNNTMGYVSVTLLKPDGTSLVSSGSSGSTINLATQTLPATGTYVVSIDPDRANTGNLTLTIIDPSANLSLNKAATQSSINWSAPAERAVDGNTNGNFWSYSVTHTQVENQPWWQVEVGSVQSIGRIDIWNRTDCCGEALTDFYVFVSDEPFTSTDLTTTLNQAGVWSYHVQGQGGTPTPVTVNRSGRYVRVQLAGVDRLSLAEVQVWRGQ